MNEINEKQKEKHLERIATKLLKDDERNQKLKNKPIGRGQK